MKRMKILTVLFVAMLMCSACSADKKEPVETDNTVSVAQEVVTPKQEVKQEVIMHSTEATEAKIIDPVLDDSWTIGHLPDCKSKKMVLQPLEYSEWYVVGFTNCEHGDPTSRDYLKERAVREIYKCEECGYTISSSHTETSVVHPKRS